MKKGGQFSALCSPFLKNNLDDMHNRNPDHFRSIIKYCCDYAETRKIVKKYYLKEFKKSIFTNEKDPMVSSIYSNLYQKYVGEF